MPTSDHHDIMLYRELGTSCVGPAIYIYEKIKFESQRPLGFAGHPAIETRCITAVGSFKFEFFKILSAESICLKLSFRLHVVAWQPDNGKYVRLKSRNSSHVRVQGVVIVTCNRGGDADVRIGESGNASSFFGGPL